jgi:hypothetical protein
MLLSAAPSEAQQELSECFLKPWYVGFRAAKVCSPKGKRMHDARADQAGVAVYV